MKGGGERRRLAHLGKVFNKDIKSSRRCLLFYTKLQILLFSQLGCNGSRSRRKMLVLSFGYAIFNFIVRLSCIYPNKLFLIILVCFFECFNLPLLSYLTVNAVLSLCQCHRMCWTCF